MARPTIYNEEILIKTQAYFEACKDESVNFGTEDKPFIKIRVNLPKVEGLALFLGVNKDTLYEWASKYPEFSDALGNIKSKQANELINKGLSGDYNPTIAKLMLSSNHGYAEKSETDITSKGEQLTGSILPEVIAEADRILKEKKLQ